MGAGGLNLPGVEKVMAEMEGGSAEEMKEKFARLGRRVSRPRAGSEFSDELDPALRRVYVVLLDEKECG